VPAVEDLIAYGIAPLSASAFAILASGGFGANPGRQIGLRVEIDEQRA
jgi:hypothetical protein